MHVSATATLSPTQITRNKTSRGTYVSLRLRGTYVSARLSGNVSAALENSQLRQAPPCRFATTAVLFAEHLHKALVVFPFHGIGRGDNKRKISR